MATLHAIQEPSARISGLSHVANRLEVVDVINECCLSRFAASALGLQCLHNTPEGVYGLEMVNPYSAKQNLHFNGVFFTFIFHRK